MSPSGKPANGTRTAAVLAVSIALALVLLVLLGSSYWAVSSGLLSGPTATPSSTPFAAATATPDFRATRTAEDSLTQVAYSTQAATLGVNIVYVTETPLADATPTPGDANVPVVIPPDSTATALALAPLATDAPPTAETAQQPISPVEPPNGTPASINLPVVESPNDQTPVFPTETATFVVVMPPTDTPTPVPPTPIATFPPDIPTPLPPSPTFTPLPPPPYVVNSMTGIIDRQNGVVRLGPSSLYTQTGTIAVGTQVSLLARDVTGEWLYICCAPNTNNPGWVRSVSARATLNPTLPAPLATAEANDIRWLTVRGPDANLTPIPTSTLAPPQDFPMARHDRGNTGRVAALPRLPLQLGWPPGGQAGLAGGAFSSGAIVVGTTVIAASADGHIYAFDRDTGSQRWRFFLGENVRATPLADGNLIFVVTENGRMVALEDQGQQAVQRWTQTLNLQPRGMVAASGRIFLTGRASDAERLLILDRGNGATLRNLNLGGAQSQIPAVGGQTVYVSSDLVRAFDIFSGETVWQSGEATSFTTPPLYSSPGPAALAELYVADASGRLISIDANTGVVLWIAPVGAAATGLAANDASVFASGPGFVRAFARALRPEGQLLWNTGIAGAALGGALVDDTRVFVGTDGGAFQFLDVVTGALLQGNIQSPTLGGAVAAAGPWIFAPSQAGVLFAAREQP